MSRRHPLYLVDAFTRTPFHGNPAAVCLLRHDCPDSTLQRIASEMNLSETAFPHPVGDDLFEATEFHLRWFTPTMEVPLCGHATLATAKVLFDELGLPAERLTFHTQSGALEARAVGEGRIRLDLPAHPPEPVATPPGLPEALGGPLPLSSYRVPTNQAVLVRLGTEADVRALHPDFPRLLAACPDAPVVIATARGSADHDFVSRVFAPVSGINEDPVTGMAHTTLGPYWGAELGKTRLTGYQASARGGEVEVDLATPGRVALTGSSRIVLRGYLDVPDGDATASS